MCQKRKLHYRILITAYMIDVFGRDRKERQIHRNNYKIYSNYFIKYYIFVRPMRININIHPHLYNQLM